MAERWCRWDSTNKKWQESTDLVNFTDMVENPLHEIATFNGSSAPSGVASKGRLYFDSTDKRLKLSEDNGSFIDVNQVMTKAGTYVDLNGITGTADIHVWRAPWDCVIVAAHALRQGGTGATVNASQAGNDILSSNLSLTTTNWTAFGTLQNTSVTAGASIAFCIRSVSGSPTQIGFTLQIRRTGA